MKKVNLIEGLKENKTTALMILGSIAEVGAIVLAIRNGVKAKHALEDLPEDATATEKAIAVAPSILPVVGLGVISLTSFWIAEKINLDKIVSLSSVSALAIQQKKNQDEAVREVVDEDTYRDIQDKATEKAISSGYRSGRPAFDMGTADATRFVEKQSCESLNVTQEWIKSRFYEWKTNALKRKAHCLIGDDIACKDLYCGYWFLPEKAWMKSLGWKMHDIPNLEIKFEYPKEKPESSEYGVPYTIFSVNIEPEELLPFQE